MPIDWENSYVDKLTLNGRNLGARDALLSQVRLAVEHRPIRPDSTKILTAIAADIVAGIESRNHVESVQAAHMAALTFAIALGNLRVQISNECLLIEPANLRFRPIAGIAAAASDNCRAAERPLVRASQTVGLRYQSDIGAPDNGSCAVTAGNPPLPAVADGHSIPGASMRSFAAA